MQTDAKSANNIPTLSGVDGRQCCVRLHGPKSLTGFKLYATSANSANIVVVPCKRTQQVTTLFIGPNNVGCRWLTMLGPFAWALRFLITGTEVCRNDLRVERFLDRQRTQSQRCQMRISHKPDFKGQTPYL